MLISAISSILFGLICEAFLHGCYTILFAVSVYLVVKRSCDWASVNKRILGISVFLYLSCTAHFVLELMKFTGLIPSKETAVFTGLILSKETAVFTAADVFVIVPDFIGELILIYRCWLLWSRNCWVIILPMFTAIMSLVCVCVALYLSPLGHPILDSFPHSSRLRLAVLSLLLCTNALVTTLIIARIWSLSPRKAHDVLGGRFPTGTGRAAIDVIIESGLLYVVVQLIFLILFAIGHPSEPIIRSIAVQIYGIAPVLIIIRVACGLSKMPTGFIFSATGLDSRHASLQRLPVAGGTPVSQHFSTESSDAVGTFTSV